ncbi:RNA polymerase sigma factor [Planctomycetota bacterium]
MVSFHQIEQTMKDSPLSRFDCGDETAFNEMVEEYTTGLMAFLRRFLHRPDLVEDVLHSTTTPTVGSPTPWISPLAQ